MITFASGYASRSSLEKAAAGASETACSQVEFVSLVVSGMIHTHEILEVKEISQSTAHRTRKETIEQRFSYLPDDKIANLTD